MLIKSEILFIVLGLLGGNALKLNDICIHQKSGHSGICKRIAECPSALIEFGQNKLPQICCYEKITAPIVCCPGNSAQPTPTETFISNNPVPQGGGTVGAKTLQKCIEYSTYVNVTYVAPTLSFGIRKNKTRSECGFRPVKLVIGGTKAKGKEFPHMALIGYDNGSNRAYACAGSLISEYFVLTAGHCLYSRQYGYARYVRVGDLNILRDDDDADPQEVEISEIIKHPGYTNTSKYNDIALLKLAKKIDFNAYVRPTCLNINRHFDAKEAIATGWGNTAFMGAPSSDLMQVTLELFGQQECKDSFESGTKLTNGISDDSQMCAGWKKDGQKDTCPGDSGGPLQIFNLDVYCMYLQVGVISFGKPCGLTTAPGVYTRVSNYIEWIENIVWP